ncbi:hypothetical protein J8273_7197 [Carpediemonas membranifera]|uniref:Uncharacterized protein n=1 Tax=Carpediemonas membranifera TaxID=201153 RepID=A0A8J6B1H8_9EUKA|nr:hypothetical protein J8273_7197 [Carpediemonas membranifera]|eukprot:KAG9390929.1 hypothetical protein J8273_7197 [Carpediemonas membranifera]
MFHCKSYTTGSTTTNAADYAKPQYYRQHTSIWKQPNEKLCKYNLSKGEQQYKNENDFVASIPTRCFAGEDVIAWSYAPSSEKTSLALLTTEDTLKTSLLNATEDVKTKLKQQIGPKVADRFTDDRLLSHLSTVFEPFSKALLHHTAQPDAVVFVYLPEHDFGFVELLFEAKRTGNLSGNVLNATGQAFVYAETLRLTVMHVVQKRFGSADCSKVPAVLMERFPVISLSSAHGVVGHLTPVGEFGVFAGPFPDGYNWTWTCDNSAELNVEQFVEMQWSYVIATARTLNTQLCDTASWKLFFPTKFCPQGCAKECARMVTTSNSFLYFYEDGDHNKLLAKFDRHSLGRADPSSHFMSNRALFSMFRKIMDHVYCECSSEPVGDVREKPPQIVSIRPGARHWKQVKPISEDSLSYSLQRDLTSTHRFDITALICAISSHPKLFVQNMIQQLCNIYCDDVYGICSTILHRDARLCNICVINKLPDADFTFAPDAEKGDVAFRLIDWEWMQVFGGFLLVDGDAEQARRSPNNVDHVTSTSCQLAQLIGSMEHYNQGSKVVGMDNALTLLESLQEKMSGASEVQTLDAFETLIREWSTENLSVNGGD